MLGNHRDGVGGKNNMLGGNMDWIICYKHVGRGRGNWDEIGTHTVCWEIIWVGLEVITCWEIIAMWLYTS